MEQQPPRHHLSSRPPRRQLSQRLTELPSDVMAATEIIYRSFGLGCFGTAARCIGMPLEKIALVVNSSQVTSNNNPFKQALRIACPKGLASLNPLSSSSPYRVITSRSLFAWGLQYSIMGMTFQIADRALSVLFDVDDCISGSELLNNSNKVSTCTIEQQQTPSFTTIPIQVDAEENLSWLATRTAAKLLLAPMVAGTFESIVSNKAEVTRFFGPNQFTLIENRMNGGMMKRICGPGFGANVARNFVMSGSSFVCTPYLFMLAMPEESRNNTSLFWFGMGFNIFAGNVVGVTMQSLWGRSLDYAAKEGSICYRSIIKEGLRTEGIRAFLTPAKWGSRVLMNAPAQGTIPWFYNTILPKGEVHVKDGVRAGYTSFNKWRDSGAFNFKM